MMLAELYVELTNKQIDSSELPHSENSRFIRFCHLAMEPHLPDKEPCRRSCAASASST